MGFFERRQEYLSVLHISQVQKVNLYVFKHSLLSLKLIKFIRFVFATTFSLSQSHYFFISSKMLTLIFQSYCKWLPLKYAINWNVSTKSSHRMNFHGFTFKQIFLDFFCIFACICYVYSANSYAVHPVNATNKICIHVFKNAICLQFLITFFFRRILTCM